MIYVLLDTNIVKSSLISKTSFSIALSQLEAWCKEKSVVILNPNILQMEWIKHSEEEMSRIKKSAIKAKEIFQTYEASISDDQILVGQETLKTQVNLISELFLNHSISFDADDDLYRIGHERKQQSKPPFHVKIDSLNDWLIFSSCIRYLKKNQLNKFYFISANTNEFSDRNKIELLHPELIEYSGTIETNYFTNIQLFIDHLHSLGYSNLTNENTLNTGSSNLTTIKTQIPLKSEIQAINELYKLLKHALKDLDFLPYRHLNEFIFSNFSEETSFNNYVLDTESKYIYKILNAIELKNGKPVFRKNISFKPTDNTILEKLNYIITQLRRNNVYHLEHDYIIDSLPYINQENCCCIRCKLEVFDLANIDIDWKNPNESIFEFHLKRGFSWLKLGNFPTAFIDLMEALKIAENENNDMLIFRAKYNLAKLGVRLRNNFMLDESYNTILEELEKIKFDPFNYSSSNEINSAVKQWMSNENYINDSFVEISRISKKIIEANRQSYNDGTSSNRFTNQIAFKYSQISNFLQNNLFYYEDFIEWKEIAAVFIEAILASYSTNDGSTKIKHLNDWILIQILKYGDRQKIDILIKQYNLKNIQYSSNYDGNNKITSLLFTVLDSNFKEFESLHFKDSYSLRIFKEKQKDWLHNTFILLGLIEFDTSFISSAIDKIINKIRRDGIEFDIFCFWSLLIRRSNIVTSKQIRELVMIGPTIPKLNLYFYFANLTEVAKEKNLKVSFSQEDFNNLNQLLEKITSDQGSAIVHLALILKGNQKEIITSKILEKLKNEDYHFEIPIYLSAVLQNLLAYDESRVKLYIEYLTPKEEPIRIGRPFINREKYNYQLNNLIDVIFKFNLPQSLYQGLLKHSDYYQWLLQIDNFNYAKFNPEWITLHDGFNYNKRFKKCKVLKKELQRYIQNNTSISTNKVRDRYYEIYAN